MNTGLRGFSMAFALLTVALCSGAAAAIPSIYPDPGKATADLAAALQQAATTHRRVILDFGADWCPDCHVLDGYFHDSVNKPLLEGHYLLVHVNIGKMDQNLDIAAKCGVPLNRGVPALAVLDSDGTVLYSQKGGEFEAMRHMETGAVTQFLQQWQGPAR